MAAKNVGPIIKPLRRGPPSKFEKVGKAEASAEPKAVAEGEAVAKKRKKRVSKKKVTRTELESPMKFGDVDK